MRLWEYAAALKHGTHSYSQFGEDVHIRSYYDRLADKRHIDVRNGLIVDIGVFRPIVYSNTYWFYRQGWRTINIDPTPGSMRIFDKIRPRDVNLEVAIAPDEGTADFYVFGFPSVWNTLDYESAIAAQQATGIVPKTMQVSRRRLDSILDAHAVNADFEILFIDAEGYDIEILASNDFERFRPRIIVIEVHHLCAGGICDSHVYKFLREYKYTCWSWINPNLVFIRHDSMI